MNDISVRIVGDEWPEGIPDHLISECAVCNRVPDFDYKVNDQFWYEITDEEDFKKRGVVCLPCLDKMCAEAGKDLSKYLEVVYFTGEGKTIELKPVTSYLYDKKPDDKFDDLKALYERGEISAKEMHQMMGGEADEKLAGILPFRNEDEEIYLSLNILERTEGLVRFKIGIQFYFGMEFLGAVTMKNKFGKKTRRTSGCKLRAGNGVTVLSMCGTPEWCPEGYYYNLMSLDDTLGRDEEDLGNGLFMEKKKDSTALVKADAIHNYYQAMTGSKVNDANYNQMVREPVFKVMGPDKKNYEMEVTDDEFEKIEFVVRAYNKYMNDNAQPGEFHNHVLHNMGVKNLLAEAKNDETRR